MHGNWIDNPTDGGIVLFGSPGTLVENNTIWVENNTLLGGIVSSLNAKPALDVVVSSTPGFRIWSTMMHSWETTRVSSSVTIRFAVDSLLLQISRGNLKVTIMRLS